MHQIPHLNQILSLRDSGFKIEEINDALKRINDFKFLETILERKLEQPYNNIYIEQQKIKKLKEN